ncbi:histone acetyltransferase subunit NuA4-domain-containing protein [Scheffersomyces xylosifermentans]|uniref:histone acetyltransferase subunit NuA4-domain-containing protein n=1 Tax=Scheffersomyces xylosifermentans TaxID=1304137 RepID=UPI00315C66B4
MTSKDVKTHSVRPTTGSPKSRPPPSASPTSTIPSTANTVSSSTGTASAGGATSNIDKYTELKNQLTSQILRKQELTAKLNALEDSIYEKENEYFNDSTYGSIVKGFENFSKTGGGGSNKKRIQYTDEDHIFSLSSVNYIKTLMKRQGQLNGTNGTAGPGGGSGSGGPSNAKDDLDDYEDSVEPGASVSSINNRVSSTGLISDREGSSNSSTPSRKRKARNLDD